MSSHSTSVANDRATTTSHECAVTAIADKIGRNDLTADDQSEIDFWTAALEEHSNRAMLNISRQALAKLLGIVGKLRTEQRSSEPDGEDEDIRQIYRGVEGQELTWRDCSGAVPVVLERRDEWAREMFKNPQILMSRTGDSAMICVIGDMDDASLYDVLVRRIAHFRVERIDGAHV
jgi:hypothetical protein